MSSLAPTRSWEKWFWPVCASAVFLIVWHVSVRWTGSSIFPSPLDVQRGMGELVSKGLLFRYAGDSLRRVAIGYLAAVLFGIPAGLLLGWYPAAGAVVNPTIQVVRPISPIAWIPISILWFGISDLSCIFLIFIASLF